MNKMKLDKEDVMYSDNAGNIMQREWGKTPNGNDLNGKWVLRDILSVMIDFDQYRHDLAERNDIKLGISNCGFK